MNGKRTSLRLYARLRARKPNKCSKTAIKISSRSKLCLARTATHVVGRNWARSPKVSGKFTSGDNFIQRVMRREKFAIFNLWAVQEAPLPRCPFVRTYIGTSPLSLSFRRRVRFFISRDRNERVHPVEKCASVSILCAVSWIFQNSVLRRVRYRDKMEQNGYDTKWSGNVQIVSWKNRNVWSPAVDVDYIFCRFNTKF